MTTVTRSLPQTTVRPSPLPLRFSTQLPRKKIGCGWAVVNTGGKSTSDGKMFCIKGLEP